MERVLTLLAGLLVTAALVLAALAVYVARRRGTSAGISLAVLLLAAAWWGGVYAVEVSLDDLDAKLFWGNLKYVGVAAVAPAWLTYVLQYTGRGHLVSRRLLLALAVEPLVILAVLANPATHRLIRYYPPGSAGEDLPIVATGPLFWVHLLYSTVLVIGATALFVTTMVRVSRLYWRLATVLILAALGPLTANLLHNFAVGPFARFDLTPFVFVVSGGVLVWGLFRERLVKLTPVARGVVVETMADGVVVLDPFGRVVDVNPAGARFLSSSAADLVGRPVEELLPGRGRGDANLTLEVDGETRHVDVRRQPLPDRSGRSAGELVVLRDVTDAKVAERRLRQLLGERTRIAASLQGSLLPAALPPVDGVSLAARYQPAGNGREIGGDFYDVFPLTGGGWGVVLGDVSGKGAEAAAVTALIRYTLRTLADRHSRPCTVLRGLNDALLRQTPDERYCTVVYGVLRPQGPDWCLTVCLGGHPQPLVARADGTVEQVGRLGTALGLLGDPDLHEVDVDLRPGDAVCLFTDGLVEARRAGELFGEERAAAVLREHAGGPPAELAGALEDAARSFRGRQLTDDLALLVLRVD